MIKSVTSFLALTLFIPYLLGNESSKVISRTRQTHQTEKCARGPHINRVVARHIEANGIGYNQGYTTIEGFFAGNGDTWIPFLDVRAHIFNNGKPAVNTGIGARYLTLSRAWGINGYYDYRKTNHMHYNQLSLGLESLGRIWDFRVNGYFPVGKKKSGPFDTHFTNFQGNYAYFAQKIEYAMKGANAEIGWHVNRMNYPIYFAAGPYYLEGQGKVAWGGEARAAVDCSNYFRIEGNTSYDNVFKWITQAQLSIIIPFGKRHPVKSQKNRSCTKAPTLSERSLQRVDRFEIIAVNRKHKKTVAIDPLTDQPYVFWFVNNASHSNGTFESPFNTLAAAESASSINDIIYVYPGDGTNNGMDSGIIMKDFQKLWGSSIDQLLITTKGNITIPASSSTMPLLGISSDNPVIVTANSCEVSGIHAERVFSSGLLSTLNIGGSNNFIHNNIFVTSGNGDCIDLNQGNIISINDMGTTNISNNIILAGDASDNFGIGSYITAGLLIINNNLFSSINQTAFLTSGIDIIKTENSSSHIVIKGNKFDSFINNSMFSFFNVSFENFATSTGPCEIDFSDNVMNVVSTGFSVTQDAGSTGLVIVNVDNNTANHALPNNAYSFSTSTPNLLIVNFANNSSTAP